MKSLLNKLFVLSALPFILWSCEKDEDRIILKEGTIPTLTSSESTLVLSRANAADTAVSFQWVPSTFGFDAAVKYTLQFDTSSNFSTLREVNVGSALTKAYTVNDFNALALSMGLPTGMATRINARVKSEVSPGTAVYSEIVPITITPYALSASIRVPGDYQGWNPAMSDSLHSLTGNGIYEGYVNMPGGSGKFKFTSHPDWNHTNYGDGGAGKISTTGGDLSVPGPGYYLLKVNTNALTWSATKIQWGLIGSATPNGWNDPDQDLSYNSTTKTWTVTLNLVPGEIKFRANDDWGINFGDDGANSSLEYGGANIPIATAGNYTVTLDLQKPGYYTYQVKKN